jgi:CheY-like chemotaxis protein
MAIKLLLADDSPTIAKILQMALQTEPYEIRSVLTAEAALKELKSNPPDVMLVDLDLPEKSGYEFARLVRKNPALENVRVVILASAFDPVNENEVKESGADGLIKKPFDPAELREKLRSVVKVPGEPPAPPVEQEDHEGVVEPRRPPSDDLSVLLESPAPGSSGDANSILSGLMGGGTPSKQGGKTRETTNATAMLDLSGQDLRVSPDEPVLDLSDSFDLEAGGSSLVVEPPITGKTKAPPPAPSKAPPAAPAIPPAPATADKGKSDLSPNAQALAAFFDAEISSKISNPALSLETNPSLALEPEEAVEASAPLPPEEDAFDASQASIDWNIPADVNLGSWSSSASTGSPFTPPPSPPEPEPKLREPTRPIPAPPKPAPQAAPPREPRPAAQQTSPPKAPLPPRASPPKRPDAPRRPPEQPAGSSSEGGNFLFDTGGSNFRFADDYVNRITRAFTGAMNEHVAPQAHHEEAEPRSLFPQLSDDRTSHDTASPPPGVGGGAWTQQDVQRIEQIVREEVQMVIREVAEKVAWEVLPELAENLIRKELDKVMKEIDRQ